MSKKLGRVGERGGGASEEGEWQGDSCCWSWDRSSSFCQVERIEMKIVHFAYMFSKILIK